MSSPDLAELRHGANVLRALAHNLPPDEVATAPPLDHPSARDAVTLLAWRGEASSETLQFAVGIVVIFRSGDETIQRHAHIKKYFSHKTSYA